MQSATVILNRGVEEAGRGRKFAAYRVLGAACLELVLDLQTKHNFLMVDVLSVKGMGLDCFECQ